MQKVFDHILSSRALEKDMKKAVGPHLVPPADPHPTHPEQLQTSSPRASSLTEKAVKGSCTRDRST